MARIFNENMWPDGGWFFIDAQGVRHNGSSLRALIGVVTEYRKRAGFEAGAPEAEVIEQVCARNPEFCKDPSPRQPPPPSAQSTSRNYVSTLAQKVSSWVSQMFAAKRMGKIRKVSTTEARRREQICARCPMQHAFPTSCGSCVENVGRLSSEVVSHGPMSNSLKCCKALAEWTPVSVWVEQPPVTNQELPPECWRKKEPQ